MIEGRYQSPVLPTLEDMSQRHECSVTNVGSSVGDRPSAGPTICRRLSCAIRGAVCSASPSSSTIFWAIHSDDFFTASPCPHAAGKLDIGEPARPHASSSLTLSTPKVEKLASENLRSPSPKPLTVHPAYSVSAERPSPLRTPTGAADQDSTRVRFLIHDFSLRRRHHSKTATRSVLSPTSSHVALPVRGVRESLNVVDALALVSPAISQASTLANEGRHGHLARVHPVVKAPRPGERARRCVVRGCQLISSMAHLLPCELHAAAKGAAPALAARAVASSALLLAERGAAFYLVVAW
eukprot:scaffold51240_cov63-Phaeocystis_antarctica.AAC.3